MANETTYPTVRSRFQNVSPGDLFPVVLLVSLIVRLIIAFDVGIQIDEYRMAWTAQTVARFGWPRFPSDVLYLLATPAGYLFAPLTWFAHGEDLVTAIRIGHVLLAAIAIVMVWIIANRHIANSWIALGATAAVAFDPMSLYWSTIATVNASIALCALAIVLVGLDVVTIEDERILARGDLSNPLVRLVIVIVIGSVTHYATWLFVTPVIVAALVRWRSRVFDPRHPVQIAFLTALVAPILVWMLGSAVGPGSGSSFNPGPPSAVQIWNNLDRLQAIDVNLGLWRSLYYGSKYAQWVPFLALATSGALIAKAILDRRAGAPGRMRPEVLTLLLGAYWLPILVIADGSFASLLLGVLPFGYLILGLALAQFAPRWHFTARKWAIGASLGSVMTLLLIAPIGLYAFNGTIWQLQYDAPDPDYFAGSRYVEGILQPDQLVLTAYPAVTDMVFSEANQARIIPLILVPRGLLDGSAGDRQCRLSLPVHAADHADAADHRRYHPARSRLGIQGHVRRHHHAGLQCDRRRREWPAGPPTEAGQ
jgi:hypothetical protein